MVHSSIALKDGLPSKKRAAFTLLELLVVAALVAVLASFLFAASLRVNKKAREAEGIGNMRQIGLALHAYIAENNQRLPYQSSPVPVKTLAKQVGYSKSPNDWSNDGATPKNSIFRNGADERAIRKLFSNGYDDRLRPDPLNTFATNEYMGEDPDNPASENNAKRYPEIQGVSTKIYLVPSFFLNGYKERFSAAPSNSPFRSAKNLEEKGAFPALFADGHVATVDPAPKGLSASAISRRWIMPKTLP